MPAPLPIPFSKSTAEIIAPRREVLSTNGVSAGFTPPPQNHMQLAGFCLLFTLFVYRVVFKQCVRFFVKVKEQILVNAFREIVLDFPASYVVRRGNFVVHDAVVYNQAMAITDARIKCRESVSRCFLMCATSTAASAVDISPAE